jgi:hypothetical protein
MSKTAKELAFLRDLIVDPEWTLRFTELFDKHFKVADEKEILYINPGTGNHAIEIRAKLDDDVRFQTFSTDTESNILAQAKTEVVKAEIDFGGEFPRESFDLVIADASFVKQEDLTEFIQDAIELTDGRVAVMLPTAGSFGEIFSLMWESCLESGLSEYAPEIERMVASMPQVTTIEELAAKLGLKKIKSHTANEVFEYENGAEFIAAPLVSDFLMPMWLDFLSEQESELLLSKLATAIDEQAEGLTFRFSVKATILTGTKS